MRARFDQLRLHSERQYTGAIASNSSRHTEPIGVFVSPVSYRFPPTLLRDLIMQKVQTIPLDELSDDVKLSKQTIVRWIDRHLIEASLDWTLSEDNEEVRTIEISEDSLNFLRSFAEEYREDVVSRTEARHILKQIDRKKIKKLIRAGDVKDVEVDEETRIVVGSIEDYLRSREGNGEEEE